MATEAFTYGDSFKFEPGATMRFNGVEGRIWVKRTKRADASGWRDNGRTHVQQDATHRDIVNRFGLFWVPELVNA